MSLRLPHEMLAGCLWLPRFVDKVRAHRDGRLPADYRLAFGHPRGVDGHFFRHFGFQREAIVAAIATAPDDPAVATWFLGQPTVSPTSIEGWNALAPNIGREGQPGREAFLFMRRRLYGDQPPAPVESAFEAIYFDETGSKDRV
ncbi:MAG: DUF5069 domain-containing protein [Opitutaceae bacterium]|nr:DUF5069 domain-containing protein [Opitutaceae bacterium]